MKFVSLLPIGAALLLSIPAAAQTVEKKEVKKQVETPQTPETPATPNTAVAPKAPVAPHAPMAPNAPVPPHAPVAPRVSVPAAPPAPPIPPGEVMEDFVIEAPIPADGIEADDIEVESSNPLRRLKIDSLDNMLRIRITRSVGERNELRREVAKLSNELRRKTREFRRLRIDADRDTTGLAKAIDDANRALEEAEASVRQLDSNIVILRSQGRGPMVAFNRDSIRIMRDGNMMMFMNDSAMKQMYWTDANRNMMIFRNDSAMKQMRWIDANRNMMIFRNDSAMMQIQRIEAEAERDAMRRFYYEYRDTLGGVNKHIVISRSIDGGDSVAGVRPTLPFGSFDGDEANVMMMISGDSLNQRVMVFNNRRNRSSCNDTTEKKPCKDRHTHALLIRSLDESADTPLDRAPVTILEDYIIVGKDSVQIVDGKDRQTVIHIDRENAKVNGRSRIVVIATSYCRKTGDAVATQESAAKENVVTTKNGYKLEANTPNPFSESTTITFTLPQPDHVTLSVFDANGSAVKVLKDEDMQAGTHTAIFDASGLPSGIYLYRLVTGGFSETKTMTVAK